MPLGGGEITLPEDTLRKASDQRIHEEITAVYEEATAKGEKPPNLEEIKRPVRERLRAGGFLASESRIRELAGAERYKVRRRPSGPTIASERCRQQS
jgi:hypothetical protein